MVRSRLLAGLAAFGGTLALALALPGVASAATGSTAARDAASTRAFIGGALGVDGAMLAHGPGELAAGMAYVSSVDGDCGDVRLHLPRKLGVKRAFVFCADARRLKATKLEEMTPAGRRFSRDALTLIARESAPGALIRRMRPYAPAAVATGLQRLKTLNHRVAQLPVARVEYKLLRQLFGKATTREGSGARVRSVPGHLGRAPL